MIGYPCTKFGDFSFSRFVFNVRTDRHADRITESQMRIIAILTRILSASVISLTVRTPSLISVGYWYL